MVYLKYTCHIEVEVNHYVGSFIKSLSSLRHTGVSSTSLHTELHKTTQFFITLLFYTIYPGANNYVTA